MCGYNGANSDNRIYSSQLLTFTCNQDNRKHSKGNFWEPLNLKGHYTESHIKPYKQCAHYNPYKNMNAICMQTVIICLQNVCDH